VERIAASAAKVNHVKAPGAVLRAMMPVMMRLMLKTAMRPEKAFGPTLRHRIDWAAPVGADAAVSRS
jgi:hypothetical protein